MKILRSVAELKEWRSGVKGTVGFVPTMGALHEGHGSLLDQGRRDDHLLLSIFINPTQFNDPKDFSAYPQTLDADLQLAREHRVDAVWTPTREDLYPDNYQVRVTEIEDSKILEGEHRPGHFEGMLTVVTKLLCATQPDRAYFGEKDFQQLHLVKKLVKALLLPTAIVAVPTVRESDGLAMSSRNRRLDPDLRNRASGLYRALTGSRSAREAKEHLTAQGFQVEYVEDWQGRRLAAVLLGQVRLIDNIPIAGGSK